MPCVSTFESKEILSFPSRSCSQVEPFLYPKELSEYRVPKLHTFAVRISRDGALALPKKREWLDLKKRRFYYSLRQEAKLAVAVET